MASPCVFLIDDEPAVRSTLGKMLSVFGFAVQTFDSADSFLINQEGLGPGCIVADVRMKGTDGIALAHELAAQKSSFPIVLISGQADIHMAVSAIKAGAQDFIEKPVDDVELVAAINRGLARLFERQGEEYSIDMLASHFARLSPRQIEIFDLVAAGCTSHSIATKLGISRRTVENHRAEIMERMQADNVAAIVRHAIRLKRIALT